MDIEFKVENYAVDSRQCSDVKNYPRPQNCYSPSVQRIIHAIPSTCDMCSVQFKNRKLYIEHIIEKHLGKDYICYVDDCNAQFGENSDLLEHQIMHHGYSICYECSQTFSNSFLLERHKCQTKKTVFVVEGSVMNDDVENKKQKEFSSKYECFEFIVKNCSAQISDTESTVDYLKHNKIEKVEKTKKKKNQIPENSFTEHIKNN